MKKYLLIFAVALTGCGDKVEVNKIPANSTWYRGGGEGGEAQGWLVTVAHDGHLFVVEGKSTKGAILHHPSCSCLKQ